MTVPPKITVSGKMNIWDQFEKENHIFSDSKGISFHYEKGIDDDLKTAFVNLAKWLRKRYCFPVHITVYVLNQEKVKLLNGRSAYGSFRWYPQRLPRIKIPAKVEAEKLKEFSLEEIYEQILSSLIHELTHYFQWVLQLEQTNAVSERQADYHRYRILDKFYAETNTANTKHT